MLAWRTGGKLLQRSKEGHNVFIDKRLNVENGIEKAISSVRLRKASPQPEPYEAEELSDYVPQPTGNSPCDNFPTARSSEKDDKLVDPWGRLVHALYNIRARAFEVGSNHCASRGVEQSLASHLTSMMPLVILLEPQHRHFRPLDDYFGQLKREMDSHNVMRQRLEEKVDSILARGGLSELRSSADLVRKLQPTLTKAILEEQRTILEGGRLVDARQYGPFLLLAPANVIAQITLQSILSCAVASGNMGLAKTGKTAISIGSALKAHVTDSLQAAKAKRLRAQHSKLRKWLNDHGEKEGCYLEFVQQFGLPSIKGGDKDLDRRMLENIRALQPYELADPAEKSPHMPLSNLAVVSYTQEDLDKAARRSKRAIHGEKVGMLDIVESRLMGINLVKRRKMYDHAARRKIEQMQARLNQLLKNSKNWSVEKEAKVGVRLIELAIKHVKIQRISPATGMAEMVPILEHLMMSMNPNPARRFEWTGILRLEDEAIEQLVKLNTLIYLQDSIFDPMLVPPLPWRGVYNGGHLLPSGTFLRLKSQNTQLKPLLMKDCASTVLEKIYYPLNCLGSVPWRINKDVLKVAEALFRSKEEVCGFPRRRSLPIEPPKKRPRFITWLGGSLSWENRRSIALSEEGRQLSDAPAGSSESRNTMNESINNQQAQVLGIEPNIQALLRDDDEGSGLWRSRTRGQKRTFKRRQLLATTMSGETLKELRVRRIKNSEIRKENRENYSQLCEAAIKMEVARSVKDEKAIYFPHNLDFRGRAYTMHPHLTHLSNDSSRGLLQFAEGRPLGKDGLDWLFVQLANTWAHGVDKLSFDQRRQFVLDNLYDILESAANPLEHKWWQKAEDPFQTLAVALDIQAAIMSGDPETHLSHTPVAMDGSCNGLQHYAALGLDLEGGAAVNLVNADQPQDVYSEVAGLVKEEASKEAAEGNAVAARLLPQVDRRLVKQTVMTSVYGVTMLGAKQQIAQRLKDREYHKRFAEPAAMYAAQKTLLGLNQRFKEAMKVMKWLNDCAQSISKTGQVVMWETPLGLPVVQPYKDLPRVHVRTTLQRLIFKDDKPDAAINRSKQRTAFPPNYVHSIDSSHMLMTAAACARAGVTFAGVHDSFWAHAANVPKMNRILREQFVELYSQPLLENLRNSFMERYPTANIPPLPKKGKLQLEDVLESTYFFS